MVSHGHAGSADPLFEQIYAEAGTDLSAVPWAVLEPRAALTDWLNGQAPPSGSTALVVACGLGDDAEELARRGYQVTAFDAAPTAIERCKKRFPDSTVNYVVADLFALPTSWQAAFDLVVEIWTLQSLTEDEQPAAEAAIAATLRPGGRLFVYCLARDDDAVLDSRPWPLRRAQLGPFIDAGLQEVELVETPPQDGRAGTFTATYQRPVEPSVQ